MPFRPSTGRWSTARSWLHVARVSRSLASPMRLRRAASPSPLSAAMGGSSFRRRIAEQFWLRSLSPAETSSPRSLISNEANPPGSCGAATKSSIERLALLRGGGRDGGLGDRNALLGPRLRRDCTGCRRVRLWRRRLRCRRHSAHSVLYFPGRLPRRPDCCDSLDSGEIPSFAERVLTGGAVAPKETRATGGGRLRALMVRVQLGRGGGDGSRALEQPNNAASQDWFQRNRRTLERPRRLYERDAQTQISLG